MAIGYGVLVDSGVGVDTWDKMWSAGFDILTKPRSVGTNESRSRSLSLSGDSNESGYWGKVDCLQKVPGNVKKFGYIAGL